MPKQKTIEQLREEEQQEELKLIQQERAAKEEARHIKATRLALQQRKYIEIGKLVTEYGLDQYDTQTLHAGLSMLAEMLKNEQDAVRNVHAENGNARTIPETTVDRQ